MINVKKQILVIALLSFSSFPALSMEEEIRSRIGTKISKYQEKEARYRTKANDLITLLERFRIGEQEKHVSVEPTLKKEPGLDPLTIPADIIKQETIAQRSYFSELETIQDPRLSNTSWHDSRQGNIWAVYKGHHITFYKSKHTGFVADVKKDGTKTSKETRLKRIIQESEDGTKIAAFNFIDSLFSPAASSSPIIPE